mmetsp:Transcript_72385/g.182625  ORF Transcript_72385/g.182625 Transcript_72385/m.182625 type:complete len:238 (-) Transcript_72385:344-1057(-)
MHLQVVPAPPCRKVLEVRWQGGDLLALLARRGPRRHLSALRVALGAHPAPGLAPRLVQADHWGRWHEHHLAADGVQHVRLGLSAVDVNLHLQPLARPPRRQVHEVSRQLADDLGFRAGPGPGGHLGAGRVGLGGHETARRCPCLVQLGIGSRASRGGLRGRGGRADRGPGGRRDRAQLLPAGLASVQALLSQRAGLPEEQHAHGPSLALGAAARAEGLPQWLQGGIRARTMLAVQGV